VAKRHVPLTPLSLLPSRRWEVASPGKRSGVMTRNRPDYSTTGHLAAIKFKTTLRHICFSYFI